MGASWVAPRGLSGLCTGGGASENCRFIAFKHGGSCDWDRRGLEGDRGVFVIVTHSHSLRAREDSKDEGGTVLKLAVCGISTALAIHSLDPFGQLKHFIRYL